AGPQSGSPPLAPAACRTRLEADLPARFASRHALHVPCAVRNVGSARLMSAGSHPTRLAYRWFDRAGNVVLDGLRVDLPRPLRPGGSARVTLPLLTPWDEGDYELRVAPVQEHVHWFDDLDPDNGIRQPARVRHPE
ncbi:MAG: hypothetical protein ACRDLS_11315, partial [Solirubrobacteraceae bacterium]